MGFKDKINETKEMLRTGWDTMLKDTGISDAWNAIIEATEPYLQKLHKNNQQVIDNPEMQISPEFDEFIKTKIQPVFDDYMAEQYHNLNTQENPQPSTPAVYGHLLNAPNGNQDDDIPAYNPIDMPKSLEEIRAAWDNVSIPLPNIDTCVNMFMDCKEIKGAPVPVPSNISTYENMFIDCKEIKPVPTPPRDVFADCESLRKPISDYDESMTSYLPSEPTHQAGRSYDMAAIAQLRPMELIDIEPLKNSDADLSL